MENLESLFDFIDRAERSRNYPPNTANGLKVALRLFETELKPEERNDLAKFKEQLQRIYGEVVRKNKNFTPGSLATYRHRVMKVLNDYEKYGVDPTKMVNWKVETKAPRQSVSSTKKLKAKEAEEEVDDTARAAPGTRRMEYPLSSGSVVIILPESINAADMNKIKTLLELVDIKD